MTVTLAKNAGFCFGVRRATEAVEKHLVDGRTRVYTLGHLIHNRIYLEDLEKRGVRSVTMQEAATVAASATPDSPVVLVIRAHGIPKEQMDALTLLSEQHPDFQVLDMTCPNVKKIHKIVERETSDDSVLLLYGFDGHPETVGILSYAKGRREIFSDENSLKKLLDDPEIASKRLIFASQTTQNQFVWKKTQEFIKKLYTNSIFFDTICNVTENRQNEAVELAKNSDCMIVIGSHDSSNTKRLCDLSAEYCRKTYLIESLSDLEIDRLHRDFRVSITAGASTPDGIISEVYKAMAMEEKFESVESFEEMLDGSLKGLHTGETVTGIVTAIDDKGIYLDLGTKVTGFISTEQISDEPNVKPREMFKVGDEVKAFVIRVNDGEGMATLSKKRIDADKNWLSIEEAYKEGTVLEGTVAEIVKGGAIIELFGRKVFIPASHSGVPRDGDMNALVGTVQRVKLIDLDEGRKRALASIRVVKSAERKEAEAALWATLEVGQQFTGVVKNLTSYGAFVDLGGIDGMVHNTELSWKRIKHPSQVVSVGQEINVYIKELDAEKKRISLGYKTEEMDVFSIFAANHEVGEIVKGKIVSIMPFGAFAEVADGVDGLIHISRLSLEKVEKPQDVVSIGQEVDVKITEIDRENRKLALSIRAILEDEARAEENARREAERAERAAAAKEEAERIAAERAEMAPYIVGSID
jgi:4-hydroxy-3-methylbut-2-enyl diphosphate reductase